MWQRFENVVSETSEKVILGKETRANYNGRFSICYTETATMTKTHARDTYVFSILKV